MKIVVAVIVSLVVFFCVFTVAFQWYFNPSRLPRKSNEEIIEEFVANLEDDNGAKYYLMACLALADGPRDEAMWDRLDKVIESGWDEEYPDLEDYLVKNKPALDLVRKGTRQEFCSMPVGEPDYEFAFMMYNGRIRHIARLFIVEAKLFEKNGEYVRAGETYATLLRFAAGISESTFQNMCTGIAVEGLTYYAMDSYLANLEEEHVCSKLVDDLVDIETTRAPSTEALKNELAFTRRLLKNMGTGWLQSRQPSGKPSLSDYLIDTPLRAGGYLMFRLQRPTLLRENERFNHVMLEALESTYPEIFTGHLGEKIPDGKLSRTWFETIYMGIFIAARGDVSRRGTIIKVALHLHLLRNGAYPDSLQELVPMVPEELLMDPFSTKDFIYRKTETSYLLYGVGPDMDDDGGKEVEPPYSLDSDGDMVFVAARTVR